MKEELCEVVEVRRKSDRVMTVVMALLEEVVRIIWVVHVCPRLVLDWVLSPRLVLVDW